MTTVAHPWRAYTPEEIDTALLELALCGGNSLMAERRLSSQDRPIPASTLRDWRRVTHADRYRELADTHARRIEQAVAHKGRENAIAASDAIALAIEKTQERLENGTIKDPANAAKSLALTKAVEIDKTLLLEGRPTSITEHRDAEEILTNLGRMVPGLVIDAEAHEVAPDGPDNARVSGRQANARELGP